MGEAVGETWPEEGGEPKRRGAARNNPCDLNAAMEEAALAAIAAGYSRAGTVRADLAAAAMAAAAYALRNASSVESEKW